MKCDELEDKWFNAYPEIMGIEGGEPTKCYGKADVDEAIAELERKVDLNKRARQYWRKEWILECKDNCLQKYKRCLAMAKWCEERIARIEKDYAFWRNGKDYAQNFYKKWHKRWLEIAEKFKEAK